MNTFGDRLKEARKAKKLTQKELAKILGTTESNVNNYEKNRAYPKAEAIIKICNELNVSADWLLGIQNKSSTENKVI